jgi:two-component system OmpR family response regulator
VTATRERAIRPMTVLVVEDYPDAATVLAELLGLSGYDVSIAVTGAAALDAARTVSPDVVLLDINLPDCDGWQVARQMRSRAGGKQPILIALTASGREADRLRSADAGIDQHILKPAEPAALLSMLARCAQHLRANHQPA